MIYNAYIDDYHIQLRDGNKFVLTISKDKCGDDGNLRTTVIFDSLLSIDCEKNDEHPPQYENYNSTSPSSSPQFAFDVTYVVVHNGLEKSIETFFSHKSYACEFHDFLVEHCT